MMTDILNYLSALSQNNSREWFHAHKKEYQSAKSAFESLVSLLNSELHQMDESIPVTEAKELTFKLMRDTRFSKDKSPYNPAFRAHIGPQGKLPVPVGYYLMIAPNGGSFLGGGLFADMFQEATVMVRNHIAANGKEWQTIITDPVFAQTFTIGGTALKKVPQGYDPSHPQAEYLKNKSWYLEYPVSEEFLKKENFIGEAMQIFQIMKPFHLFLNQALKEFTMPQR